MMQRIYSDIWRNMDYEGKIQVYEQYRKTANRRLRRLRESGKQIPILASDYLESMGKRTYGKFLPKKYTPGTQEMYLDIMLDNITTFLGLKRSTLTGIKEVDEQIYSRVEKYLEKNSDISIDEIRKKIRKNDSLINFLQSNTFKALKSRINSFILVEDYLMAVDLGLSEEDILQSYDNFLKNEISEDVMRKRLQGTGLHVKRD